MTEEIDCGDDEDDAEILINCEYYPEEFPEMRRKWCVSVAVHYFSGQGYETAIRAAGEIEEYLKQPKSHIRVVKSGK